MTSFKLAVCLSILVLCIMHTKTEDIVINEEINTSTIPTPVSKFKPKVEIAKPSDEDLVKECSSRDLKRCTDSKCRQVRCSSQASTLYGCLPKGNDFLKYKNTVCNEPVGTVTPNVDTKPASPDAPKSFSLVYLLTSVLLISGCGMFLLSKIKTQRTILLDNIEGRDLESKEFGKQGAKHEFSDLDDTVTSFTPRYNRYRATKTPEYYLIE